MAFMKLLLVLINMFCLEFAFSAQDYNGQGFDTYKKGDFKKAIALFEKAVQSDPQNAFAWLNHGRALVALNKNQVPEDYCQIESNWIYQALASISLAVEIDSKNVIPKLESSDEKYFKKFKTSNEYKKWRVVHQPLPKTQNEMSQFLNKNNEWLLKSPGGIPQLVSFKKDNKVEVFQVGLEDQKKVMGWQALADHVLIINKSTKRKFNLRPLKFYFNEGQKYYTYLALKEDGGNAEEWNLGPTTDDCD